MSSLTYHGIQRVYNAVLREHLPMRLSNCGGVPAKYGQLLDRTASSPNYKRGFIEAIYEHCEGKDVELIGLGRGVSTIHALRAGATEVVAYEAAAEMISQAQETFAGCPHDRTERVQIRHYLVGDDVDVYGEDVGHTISPSELLGHDVLVMDCEGAEVSILTGIEHVPQVCIVETHPERGVPTEQTREVLEEMFDEVSDRKYKPDDSVKRVLVGVNE